MKKIKALFIFFLGVIIGVVAVIGIYLFTVGDVAWKEYLETKLIPNVVLAITTASTIYFTAKPTITRIKSSSERFDTATSGVTETMKRDKSLVSEVQAYREELVLAVNEIRNVKNDIFNAIAPVKSGVENVQKAVRIGFCNTSELVKNGYAAEIARVGEKNG